jgi:hypothetical protein
MSANQVMKKSYRVNVTKAGRYMVGLDALGTPQALKLKDEMVLHLDKVAASVKAVGEAGLNISETRETSHQADKMISALLESTLLLAELLDPVAAGKLPSKDSFATLDIDIYVERLASGLEHSSSEKLRALATPLNLGRHKRLEALRAYQQACDQRSRLQSAKADIAELGMLLKMAEVLILRSAAPDSPALDALKPARGSSSKTNPTPGPSPTGTLRSPSGEERADSGAERAPPKNDFALGGSNPQRSPLGA